MCSGNRAKLKINDKDVLNLDWKKISVLLPLEYVFMFFFTFCLFVFFLVFVFCFLFFLDVIRREVKLQTEDISRVYRKKIISLSKEYVMWNWQVKNIFCKLSANNSLTMVCFQKYLEWLSSDNFYRVHSSSKIGILPPYLRCILTWRLLVDSS